MKEELVSIVVPIYKVEQYLKECIDSIINQTYRNLEIILVDDGSPDKCGEICDEYAKQDNRIKVIHKKNGGLSSARNAGLDAATGKYISFIDSDDCIDEKYIELMQEVLLKKDVDMVQCTSTRKYGNLYSFKYKEVEIQEEKISIQTSREVVYGLNMKKHGEYVMTCNKLFKKCLFDAIRYPLGRINEDNFVTYKILWNAKSIAIIDIPLYFYRKRNESIMNSKFSIKRYDALDGFKEQLEFFKEKNEKRLIMSTAYIYQKHIKDFWYKTKKEIETDKNMHLKKLIKRSRAIYGDIIFNKEISFKNKLVFTAFNFSPKLYFGVVEILRKIKFNLKVFANILKYKIYRFKHKNNEYILFGAPTYGNIGDHAISIATKEFFANHKKNLFMINSSISANKEMVKAMSKYISENATVCIIGGGFVGSLWEMGQNMIENTIISFPKNKVILLPQTLYYENDEYGEYIKQKDIKTFENHKKLYLFWREERSFEKAKEIFKNNKNYLCPDMALYLEPLKNISEKNNRILVCLRKDKENNINTENVHKILEEYESKLDYTDTVINKDIKIAESNKYVIEKIKQFSKYNLIITDRLHGMIMAALAQTPCIVFDNASHKVKGVYEKWLKDLKYISFIDDEKNFKEKIEKYKSIKECHYLVNKELYDELIKILQLNK